MRKSLSLSAILSSLLATPLLAAPPLRPQDIAAPEQSQVIPAPADIDQQFHDQLQALRAGAVLDAHGMQMLQRQMAADMEQHLGRMLQEQRAGHNQLYQVQIAPQSFTQVMRTERAAFLGVTTSPVSATVREQLKLARGMGLVIDFVEKDSPADAAGLKLHDVLQKLDDQWLVNPQQLAVLIRGKKAGDSIPFTVIRAGEVKTLMATLGEKDLPVLESLQDPTYFMNPQAAPITPFPREIVAPQGEFSIKPHTTGMSFRMNSDGTQMRTYIDDDHEIVMTTAADGSQKVVVKDRAGNTLYEGAPDARDVPVAVKTKLDELNKKPGAVSIHIGDGKGGQTAINSDAMTLNRTDDDHQISIRIDGKGRTVTVKDVKSGKVIFDGPVTSDDDLKSLPAAVQEKVKALSLKSKLP